MNLYETLKLNLKYNLKNW